MRLVRLRGLAEHKVSGGYTTDISLHRCLEGYLKTRDQVRIGTVSAYHPESGTVDVKFFTSQDPVVKELTTVSHEYRPLEVDDMVICLFQEHGEGRGVCLGRVYSDANLPVNPGEQFTRINLWDGFVEHDRDEETLTIGGVKKIIIQCEVEVQIGDVRVPAGDVIAAVRSLNTHGH